MKIRYKTIEHERVEDSPFVGAIISAIDCWENCLNCFNGALKSLPTQETEASNIIAEVKSNPLNEGIILAGLEWTMQPEEMLNLLYTAKQLGLKTMLYTDMSGNDFSRWFRVLQNSRSLFCGVNHLANSDLSLYLDYIKFGVYNEAKKSEQHYSCNVRLASTNQYIMKV